MKLLNRHTHKLTAHQCAPLAWQRRAYGPVAMLTALCLAFGALPAPQAEANKRVKPVLRVPRIASPRPDNPIKLGQFGGTNAYHHVSAAAMDIMKRFPPDETVYVGVGRSPASVMAYLKAAGGGGDDADFGAIDFPVSGLGHSGSRQHDIDATWEAYRALFKAFLPLKQLKQLRGAKRVLLIDLTSGTSTENFRYAVRKYLSEEGIGGLEIETFSLSSGARLGQRNSAASAFVFRGAQVDHVLSQGIDGTAFGKEQVAVYTVGNVAGSYSPDALKGLVNPQRVALEDAIKDLMQLDAQWMRFLSITFRHLIEPGGARAAAKPGVDAAKVKLKLRTFGAKGQWAPDLAIVDAADEQQQQYTFSAAEYLELRDASLLLTKKFSPQKAYYLGVGRSAAAPAAFLGLLGKNVAGYLPIDGLGTYVKRGRPLSANDLQAFSETFDAFIPADALAGNRDIVLFQKISSGDSLAYLKPLVEQWLLAKGYPNQVRLVALADAPAGQAGFDAVLTSKLKTFAELGTRKYNLVAPYAKFRPGSSKNTADNTPYDLQSKQAKPAAPQHGRFIKTLDTHMSADPQLVNLKF